MSILNSLLKPIPSNAKYSAVLTHGGLDFVARKVPVFYKDENGNDITLPFHSAVYNPKEGAPLGVVGSRYELSQYSDTFSICEVLESEPGVKYVSAGNVMKGAIGFIIMKTPEFVELSPGHRVECHFYLISSHDGSTCLEGRMIPLITNTGSLVGLPGKAFKIRHTKSLEAKVAAAKGALVSVRHYWKEASEAFAKMATLKLSESEVDEYFKIVIEGDSTRADNVRADIQNIYSSSIITGFPCTNKTLLGAYFSVVTWVDGYKGVKKSKKKDEEESIIHSRLVGAGATQKSEAYADALDFFKKFGV